MPRSKSKRPTFDNIITLRFSSPQLAWLKHQAYEEEDVSVADLVRRMVDETIAKERQPV